MPKKIRQGDPEPLDMRQLLITIFSKEKKILRELEIIKLGLVQNKSLLSRIIKQNGNGYHEKHRKKEAEAEQDQV